MGSSRTRQAGLAALELVIVVTVLVLLTGVLVPSIDRARLSHQRNDASADMRLLGESMRQYRADTGEWPRAAAAQPDATTVEVASALTCMFENSFELAGWDGPYLPGTDAPLRDPWGQPYVIYTFATDYCHSGGGISLVSGGPDGSVATQRAAILAGSAMQDDLVELVAVSL